MAYRKHWQAFDATQRTADPSSAVWTSCASLTVEAADLEAGAKYLVLFGFEEIGVQGAAGTARTDGRLLLNGAATAPRSWIVTPTTTATNQPIEIVQIGYGFIWEPGGAPATTTFELQFKRNISATASGSERNARILVLKLEAQDVHALNTAQNLNVGPDFVTHVTLNFTPATPGDYLVLGFAKVRSRPGINEPSVILDSGDIQTPDAGLYAADDGDRLPVLIAKRLPNRSGPQSVALKVRRFSGSSTSEIYDSLLVALRLDQFDAAYLSEAPGDVTITNMSGYTDGLTVNAQAQVGAHLVLAPFQSHTSSTAAGFVEVRRDGVAVSGPDCFIFTDSIRRRVHFHFSAADVAAGPHTWSIAARAQFAPTFQIEAGADLIVLNLGLRGAAQGAATGGSTAAGDGAAFASASASAAGAATVLGTGGAFRDGRAAAAGVAVVAGFGTGLLDGVASAAGLSVALAEGFAFVVRPAPPERRLEVPAEPRVLFVLDEEFDRTAEHYMNSAFGLDAYGFYIEKDPDASLDYTLDWSAWLGEGDSLATSTFDVEDGLTMGETNRLGPLATVWLSGGALGATYRVTNRVTSNVGRADERTFRVRIRAR